MSHYLCLPLLVVLLQPSVCLNNCSSDYQRIPGRLNISFTEPDSLVLTRIMYKLEQMVLSNNHKMRKLPIRPAQCNIYFPHLCLCISIIIFISPLIQNGKKSHIIK